MRSVLMRFVLTPSPGRRPLLVLLALVALAAPATADVLVTVDGARIETQGAWEVKRGMVVFTHTNGTLSSLRLAEVDLDASHEATAAARRPAEAEAAPERRAPVATITDEDIPRGQVARGPVVASGGDAGLDATADPEGDATPASSAGDAIVLDSWRTGEIAGFDGVQLEGRVRNGSQATVSQISVQVEALDREGTVVGGGRAFLTSTTLPPGAATNFRLPLADVYRVDDVRIVARATEVAVFLEQSSGGPTSGSGQ